MIQCQTRTDKKLTEFDSTCSIGLIHHPLYIIYNITLLTQETNMEFHRVSP
jgi:hypothetical protein